MSAPIPADVRRYIDTVQDERREKLMMLHELITGMYPAAEAVIAYGIPMYKLPTGKAGIGYWKQGVSLYPGAVYFEDFKAKHPHIKTSKGTIAFKLADKIPVTDLKKVIKLAMERKK
jgi:uncharacterized protein YdhG (YjbR/CyaY superfamily)